MNNTLKALVAAAALSGCVSEYGEVTAKSPVNLTARQQSEAKSAVTYTLIDPQSAMFRNVRGRAFKFDSGVTIIQVCGEVNGRNRMGGYSGFSAFHGDIDPAGKFTLRNVDGYQESLSYYTCR